MIVKSICPYCGVGCGIEIESKNGKVLKILPQKDHPLSKGKLCIKGSFLKEVVNSKERLKFPLLNKGRSFKKISWKEAINLVAEQFSRIKKTYGSNSIGIFASTKCTNEENYLLQKFARVAIGTNNIDNPTRLCHAPTSYGLYQVLGNSAMTNSYEDLSESELILIFGDNPALTQPVAFELISKERENKEIVVVDVKKTETAEKADDFLMIKPNTDVLFLVGMAKVILEENLEDQEFIKKRTEGFENFKEKVKSFDLKEISELTGIKEEKIREISRKYAKTKKAAIVYGMGITQQSNSLETILALTNLVLLTGHVGKPGTGLNPLRGCNNVQGCCDMGCLPNVYPGYSSLTEETIKKFKKIWKVNSLPISKGLSLVEMVEAIPERILGLYVVGVNPLISFPDLNRIERDFKNLEFLVVQDIFLTETAELADVVLPSACFAEKTGTFTNSERRVQLIQKAAKPPGKALEDWKIVKLIAKKMGFGKYFNFKSPEQIFEEIRKCVGIYSGMSYGKLKKKSLQWPCDKENPNGTKILYGKSFGKKEKAVFYPPTFTRKEFNEDFPFVLTTFRFLEHYNTGSMSRRVEFLKKIKPEALLEMNEEDAKELGIKEGEKVKVISPLAEVEAKVKFSHICKGCVALPFHFKETKTNKLIWRRLDPVSKIPSLKYCYVRIEKISKAQEKNQ